MATVLDSGRAGEDVSIDYTGPARPSPAGARMRLNAAAGIFSFLTGSTSLSAISALMDGVCGDKDEAPAWFGCMRDPCRVVQSPAGRAGRLIS